MAESRSGLGSRFIGLPTTLPPEPTASPHPFSPPPLSSPIPTPPPHAHTNTYTLTHAHAHTRTRTHTLTQPCWPPSTTLRSRARRPWRCTWRQHPKAYGAQRTWGHPRWAARGRGGAGNPRVVSCSCIFASIVADWLCDCVTDPPCSRPPTRPLWSVVGTGGRTARRWRPAWRASRPTAS